MEKIKIGILGSGGYGRSARSYFNESGEFTIVACMDVNYDLVKKAIREEGDDVSAYTSLDDFLSHRGMQAVSINTPVYLHYEHAVACLKAGKHVFITKPVTAELDEANVIHALAVRKRLACMVGHHTRLYPAWRKMTDYVKGGKLGRLCNGIATCCAPTGLVQKKGSWRTLQGKNPGGPLLQCGIHTIDWMIGTFGPVKQVSAIMQDDVTKFPVVDNTITLMIFESGVHIVFVCNYTTAYYHTIHLFGTKANLHYHDHVTGMGQEELYLQEEHLDGFYEPWIPQVIPAADKIPHGCIIEKEFARQIRNKRPDYTNLHESMTALQIIHAAIKSHESRRVIELRRKNDFS